jgi:ssDNA-binding Zn-finger/Zn-ribbon topoisomerase 1
MICRCGNNMVLRLIRRGELQGSFFWGCSTYPLCMKTQNYVVPENRFDFANNDFMPIIKSLTAKPESEKQEIIVEIKVQMIEILKHFIVCTWGAHYNTMFDMLIKPYLTDPNTLDYILRSEIINESKGNVVRGTTGAKIYPELNYYLNNVNSMEIKNYLKKEFATTYNSV